ncbi:MAG: hypothetical protein LC107_12090 [Chitinophagales bacterium]|nr:hypothetical protein [Chitinophagales bacterium]
MRRQWIWVLAVLLGILNIDARLEAQGVTSVMRLSRDSALIGDKVHLKVQIKYSKDIQLNGLDFSGYDQILNRKYALDSVNYEQYADLTILDFGAWKGMSTEHKIEATKLNPVLEGDTYVIENTLTIAIYNAGDYRIPPPNFIYEGTGSIIPSTSPMIQVFLPESIQSDTLMLNPIKDIMVEKANWSDYVWLLYVLGGILGVLLIIYLLKNRKHKPREVEIQIEPSIPAHEKALTALQVLKGKRLWQDGHIKAYQSELTNIIRQYLEDRYQVKALEMTTDEISSALERTDFEAKYKAALREILQVADLVKFAKAIPSDDIHESFMYKAIDFVEHTKEVMLFSNDAKTSEHD